MVPGFVLVLRITLVQYIRPCHLDNGLLLSKQMVDKEIVYNILLLIAVHSKILLRTGSNVVLKDLILVHGRIFVKERYGHQGMYGDLQLGYCQRNHMCSCSVIRSVGLATRMMAQILLRYLLKSGKIRKICVSMPRCKSHLVWGLMTVPSMKIR